MELTIKEALQQGVAAHREGKLQRAEQFYRAILRSDPKHADANHNLGVIAFSEGNTKKSLQLFKTALESNKDIEQFWLSYIDALIKEQHFNTAKTAIIEGQQQGFDVENLSILEVELTQVLEGNAPTPQQQKSLLGSYKAEQYGTAERLALSITQEFPEHPFGWKILGAILKVTGRSSDAVNANTKAVDLSPQDVEALNNLGATLKDLDRLEEAEKNLRQALVLKPDLAEAHNNLGSTLQSMGKLDEAEISLRQAISFNPDYAVAFNNLGVTLKKLGRLREADATFRQAIALKSDFSEAHSNLGFTLKDLGMLDEAEERHRIAINLQLDSGNSNVGLGNVLLSKGKHKEGIDQLRIGNGSIFFDIDDWVIL